MNRIILFSIFYIFYHFQGWAQFAPPVGQEGSTAIHADSSVFIAWANTVEIERGYINIAETSLGYADFGNNTDAFGKADNMVVSLGDAGKAVFYFEEPITNGTGPDFAIFENSMWDDFLELCFVEVSSDGINFFRFPAISNTPDSVQIGSFGTIDASLVHNFGGKYRALYGTPFDLEELKNTTGIDVNQVSHVRLVDVVGSVDPSFASYDSHDHIVNDPWPTPYNTSGFDLDALGIIHSVVGMEELNNSTKDISISFIRKNGIVFIQLHQFSDKGIAQLYNLQGKYQKTFLLISRETSIDLSFLRSGLYIINVQMGNNSLSEKILIN